MSFNNRIVRNPCKKKAKPAQLPVQPPLKSASNIKSHFVPAPRAKNTKKNQLFAQSNLANNRALKIPAQE